MFNIININILLIIMTSPNIKIEFPNSLYVENDTDQSLIDTETKQLSDLQNKMLTIFNNNAVKIEDIKAVLENKYFNSITYYVENRVYVGKYFSNILKSQLCFQAITTMIKTDQKYKKYDTIITKFIEDNNANLPKLVMDGLFSNLFDYITNYDPTSEYVKDSILNNLIEDTKGMSNPSAQCFFNSVIQMLNKIDDFRHYIRCYNGTNDQINTIKDIFDRLNDNKIKLVDFPKVQIQGNDSCLLNNINLGRMKSGFHDAYELLDGLLDYLEKNDKDRYQLFNKTIINQLKHIQICLNNDGSQSKNKIIDGTTQNKSPTYNTIKLILNPDEQKNIQELIKLYDEFKTDYNTKDERRISGCTDTDKGINGTFSEKYQIILNNNNKYIILFVNRMVNDGKGTKIFSEVKLNNKIFFEDDTGKSIEYKSIGAVIHIGENMNGRHYIYTDLVQNENDKEFVKMGKIYDDSNIYDNQEKYTGSYKEIMAQDFLEKNAYLILCKRVL